MTERPSAREIVGLLSRDGASHVEIAETLQRQFGLNARAAYRMAHGWSQIEVAEEWNRRWPDKRKNSKNFSYWEQWPADTGYAPSLDVLDRLAQLYQCSVADLLADLGNYRPADGSGAGLGKSGEALEISMREAPRGWYIRSLATLLQLDLETPAALEERTIVSTKDELAELDIAMGIPRHPQDTRQGHGLDVQLLSGGRLDVREQPHDSQFRHVITLAAPLQAGEEHRYRLSIRIPPGQPMANHSVHVPLQRSDSYDLTVRFSPRQLPTRVWRVERVPPVVLRDQHPQGPTVDLDRFGEVNVKFHDLLQGQAYGLRWTF
jgi:transcriptional regulator with XRE-family HTH domain